MKISSLFNVNGRTGNIFALNTEKKIGLKEF